MSREEAETTTFAEALERYANEITPRKKGARQERDRIEYLEDLDLSQRSLASIREGELMTRMWLVVDLKRRIVTLADTRSGEGRAVPPMMGRGSAIRGAARISPGVACVRAGGWQARAPRA